MVAHEYEGVHSSPANVQHYQTRGHARNNPHLALPSHAETDRFNMMSDSPHTTVPLRFDNMMKAYLPPVDPTGFDAIYPTDTIKRIHAIFYEDIGPSTKKADRVKETVVSEAWRKVAKAVTLCPGYLFNISEKKPDATDPKKYKIDAALIATDDKHLIEEGSPNFFLDDLAIEFKRGGTENDAWNDHSKKDVEAGAETRTGVRGQLMSYGERIYLFQHRTGLFMLVVNGNEFRVIRWDRSGCIVTEALHYVETVEHTKKLLQFLYAYSQATPEQRGFDPTATRLSKDSCGWQWMQKVATAHPQDIAHTDKTVVPSLPPGFVINPTCDAPPSALFATNFLADDPTATTGFGDLSSPSAESAIAPVFKYVRDFFRESIAKTRLCYRLKVCDRDYLVGDPIFAPHGLVGRGTRGYVALEWKTQRLVFLKDAWRPFYHGVDQEGATLERLNLAEVSSVPTLICHEDVGEGQETEASQYASTGSKNPDVFDEQTRKKKDRPIAALPGSRSGASGSSASTTQRSSGSNTTSHTQSSSGSNKKRSNNATDAGRASQGSGGRSGKRTLPQDTAPMPPKDGFGLRHLTHYRIVVAEVCLPSTEIMSSEQLMQVVWNCMTAHRDAAVNCGILHRDVSSGNILIRPEVVCADSKTGKSMVLWYGVLSDWELAKALPDDKTIAKARQPHRTGTWYYMSVYACQYPGRSLSIADELESFLHVIIYLAVRFLRTSSLNVWEFVDGYFEGFDLDDGRITCGHVKEQVIQNGSLTWKKKPISFLSAPLPEAAPGVPQKDSAPLSPLNDVIAKYLEYFQARYAILEYERQVAWQASRPLHSLQGAIEAATSAEPSEVDALAKNLRRARYKAKGFTVPSAHGPEPVPRADPKRPMKPAQSVYEMAANLETHDAILDMLATEVDARVWPSDDYAGDQLLGYIPRQLQSTAKRLRRDTGLRSTTGMRSIPEGQELPERARSGA